MFGRLNSFLYNFIRRQKIFVSALIGIILLLSALNLPRIKYGNNIESMLPANREIVRDMQFLRESGFSDKLIISLKLKDEIHTTQDLILAVHQLTASINSPLVNQTISTISGNAIPEMVEFLKYAPQLLGPEAISKMASQITPSGVEERIKYIYRQSLTPGGSFMMPFMRADPLGVSSEILRAIEKLSTSSGYEVVVNNGHLMSRDGRHAMVILKTPVSMTEGFGSREVIAYLKGQLHKLPEYISADIIAGHMHTVSNEDVIKRDIWLTSTMASLAFVILFLFVFRDLKAIIIFLIPLAAVIVSTNITYLVFENASYLVMGMGTVIAGIAIDYGIYVYIALSKTGSTQETTRKVIKPVIFCALTTISVFSVFFFSSVKGYHQLAFFSDVSIILCIICTLFILPHFLSVTKNPLQSPFLCKLTKLLPTTAHDHGTIIIWVVMMATMIIFGTGLRFNNDITQFDGVGKDVLLSEEEFHNAWGGRIMPGIFVVSAKTLQDAYKVNTEVYEAAINQIGKTNFTSFASVWPGINSRRANLLRWQEFWTSNKESAFKKTMEDYGKVYNFSQDAFHPFYEQMHPAGDLENEPKGLMIFDQLKEQFVFKKENGYQIVSFFPDQDRYSERLSAISSNYPGAFLVSRSGFSNAVSHAIGSELVSLSCLAVFLTVALTFLLLKNVRQSILALVPVLTSIIMIAGIIPLAGLALNMPSIIASMVVVGIVSDYGMFVVYYCKYKIELGTYMAVTCAAVTTLIGTGVLLFARHPIHYSIGVTLTTGVLSGYLASIIIVPPLYRLWIPERD